MTAETTKMYEETGLLHPGRGYFYETVDEVKMVEIHVDEIPENNLKKQKTGKPITY
jgi:hypothetical protein